MPFFSALSTVADTEKALREVLEGAHGWADGPADLALLFYAPDHGATLTANAGQICQRLGARHLLGCPGETIIANDREIEQEPALALWLGRWSAPVRITPFHLDVEATPDGRSLLGWPDEIGDAKTDASLLLTLGDPFSFPVDDFLARVDREKPGLAVIGGMASGGHQPGQNVMLGNNRAVHSGAVGVLLQGALGFRSVVSQGCRPIGKPMVITRAEENLILELGGESAVTRLQALWQELSPRDQELARGGLHVGRVISEYQESFRRGDFLIRNVMGLDRGSGGLAIADHIRVGQTIQFHVRDAQTADEDLRLLLQTAKRERPSAGGLLFSCNGRGTRLFEKPHHDARAVADELGPLPLAGFFAQGELGPVGGQNFIHGFTASLLLFDE